MKPNTWCFARTQIVSTLFGSVLFGSLFYSSKRKKRDKQNGNHSLWKPGASFKHLKQISEMQIPHSTFQFPLLSLTPSLSLSPFVFFYWIIQTKESRNEREREESENKSKKLSKRRSGNHMSRRNLLLSEDFNFRWPFCSFGLPELSACCPEWHTKDTTVNDLSWFCFLFSGQLQTNAMYLYFFFLVPANHRFFV